MLFCQLLSYLLVLPLQHSLGGLSETRGIRRDNGNGEMKGEWGDLAKAQRPFLRNFTSKIYGGGGGHKDDGHVPGGTQPPEGMDGTKSIQEVMGFAEPNAPNSEENQEIITVPGQTTLIADYTSLRPDQQAARRFTTQSTVKTRRTRTKPIRLTFTQDCDNLIYYCMKAYNTDRLCGRSIYFFYQDFQNYCMLDYVNCMERYQYWQVVHMGECVELETLKKYKFYPYKDDSFLHKYHADSDEEF